MSARSHHLLWLRPSPRFGLALWRTSCLNIKKGVYVKGQICGVTHVTSLIEMWRQMVRLTLRKIWRSLRKRLNINNELRQSLQSGSSARLDSSPVLVREVPHIRRQNVDIVVPRLGQVYPSTRQWTVVSCSVDTTKWILYQTKMNLASDNGSDVSLLWLVHWFCRISLQRRGLFFR